MMARPEKLNEAELLARLADMPDWELLEGKLHRTLRFSDFVEAFGFMTRIALVAETMGHHPEWSNVWNRVSIDLTTHDAGGISELDFQLAEKIDSLA